MAVGRKRRGRLDGLIPFQMGFLYPRFIVTDSRGNRVVVPQDATIPMGGKIYKTDGALAVRMSYQSLATSRGEIPGQLTNEEVKFYVSPIAEDGRVLADLMRRYTGHETGQDVPVGPWTQISFDGRMWDISAPPVFKRGTRRTSHWEMTAHPSHGGDIARVRDAVEVEPVAVDNHAPSGAYEDWDHL